MGFKIAISCTTADVAVCNALVPPEHGIDIGSGRHVIIPADWQTRIAAGQDVPGCAYHRLELDGSILVADTVRARLANALAIASLPAAQQVTASALETKVAATPVFVPGTVGTTAV